MNPVEPVTATRTVPRESHGSYLRDLRAHRVFVTGRPREPRSCEHLLIDAIALVAARAGLRRRSDAAARITEADRDRAHGTRAGRRAAANASDRCSAFGAAAGRGR